MVPPKTRGLSTVSRGLQGHSGENMADMRKPIAQGDLGGDPGSVVAGHGERIRWLRATSGLKQEAFARAVGCSSRALGDWENEISAPRPSNVRKLARFAAVPLDEFTEFLLKGRKLTTAPKQLRKWLAPPVTERFAKRTLVDLRMLLKEAEQT